MVMYAEGAPGGMLGSDIGTVSVLSSLDSLRQSFRLMVVEQGLELGFEFRCADDLLANKHGICGPEGRLGILAIVGSVYASPVHRGADATEVIPQMLHDLGVNHAQTVFIPTTAESKLGTNAGRFTAVLDTPLVNPYDRLLAGAQLVSQIATSTTQSA